MRGSSRLIAALLRLYPRGYRERHGADLAAAIAACAERERRSGARPLVTAIRLAADAAWSSLLVRRDARRTAVPASGDSAMHSLIHDLRHALRALRRAPVFSALVVATLALAIGATTTIFSVVDAVVLRPLPYPEAGRLVILYQGLPSRAEPFGFSAPDAVAFRERSRSYERLGAFRSVEFELSGVSQPERVAAARISASLLGVLDVAPALGRSFTAAEDEGRQPVALLSDRLWRRAFNADPGAVGRTVTLDRRPYTIVGVMPAGFVFPHRGARLNNIPADVYVPISFTAIELGAFGSMYNNSLVGRLRAGVTPSQAGVEAAAVARQIVADLYPAQLRDAGFPITATVRPMQDEIVAGVRRLLVVLLAAVGVLLLIACADIACLMLTRAAGRAREIAIRTALGANRARVARLMMAETGVLAAIGAAAGLALAWAARAVLLASPAVTLPRGQEVSIDGRVLAFTAAVALVTTFLCGVLPAWETARHEASGALKDGTRGASAGRRQRRMLSALVTMQFAGAVVLLAAGLLLARSFARTMSTDPGFRSDHAVSVATSLPPSGYPDAPSIRRFYASLLERVATLPGVTAVGAGTDLPLSVRERRVFTVENPSPASRTQSNTIAHDWVMGHYFEALGARIVRGRPLSPGDSAGAEPVVVVNETLASRYWPGEDAVGRRLAWGNARTHGPWMRVVGIVGDIRQAGLTTAAEPQTWQPWEQLPDGAIANNPVGIFRGMRLMARTTVEPLSLTGAIRDEVRRLDPALPVTGVQTLDDVVGTSAEAQRFNAVLLGGFAGAALLLAALGIGGVLAISVSRRAPEIGIRLALGANPHDVVRMVIRQGMALVLAGLVIGLPAAFAATRLLRTLLFGVTPFDPVSFALATAILCGVALAACAVPAVRAMRVDPVGALRV